MASTGEVHRGLLQLTPLPSSFLASCEDISMVLQRSELTRLLLSSALSLDSTRDDSLIFGKFYAGAALDNNQNRYYWRPLSGKAT